MKRNAYVESYRNERSSLRKWSDNLKMNVGTGARA